MQLLRLINRIVAPVIGSAIGLFTPLVQANDFTSPATERRVYEFPVLDFPYNSSRAPSMRQSLQLSTDFYLATHNLILDGLSDSESGSQNQAGFWPVVTLTLLDVASIYAPLGYGWMHEEWHRAALGQRGIDSKNNIYQFELNTSFEVSDLANLKRNHPQDLVRMLSAGMESQYEQTLEMEKQAFFNNHHPLTNILGIVNITENIGYLGKCISNMMPDGDCNIWVYELFRPTAPGYFQSSKILSAEEKNYLRRQYALSYLNLLDPFLFGKNGFTTPSGNWMWNANLRHELTPFGYTLASNLFLKSRDDLNIFGTVHLYSNDTGTYPGLDVSLPRYPIPVFDKPAHVTPRLVAWMQPESLMFRDTAAKLGGLISARLEMPVGSEWSVYGEVENKSPGWVAANEYLGSNFSIRLGLLLITDHKTRWRSNSPATIQ